MKRDIEYSRSLLRRMEEDPSPWLTGRSKLRMSEAEQKEAYHLHLLCDAGLVREHGKDVYRLTNQGHEFLDAISKDDDWTEVKQRAAKVSANAGLTILTTIAIELVKEKLKGVMGLAE